ncbi:hypothetical protein NLG97_g9741 [Lecanicillium saksenae]|uniref:Uncharacterized protein n=1 Tax=Lecanicillium saksenae TaxID=468837 RepID=A0ACC1QF56_9HYPO|nr:hypothetical protein NLG97_g9741 [Lecanicillium saksenae]
MCMRYHSEAPNFTTSNYFDEDMWYFYIEEAVSILRQHDTLKVAFVRAEWPYYAAAKRVGGRIFTMAGKLEDTYSRYRFPLGLLDEENVFPADLVAPERSPDEQDKREDELEPIHLGPL